MTDKNLYQFIYKKTPVMLQAIDGDGVMQAVSKKWLEKLGFEEHEVIGKKVFEFLSEETNTALLSGLLEQIIEKGELSNQIIECVKKNGEIFEAVASAEVIYDSEGNPKNITWALYDVEDTDAIPPNANHHIKQLIRIKNQLIDERDYLRDELDQVKQKYPLISQSLTMQHLFEKLKAVSQTDATVMIFGETGSGKELVARTIVNQSERAEMPFVTINCASVTKDLFESEFFGHVKGSFTGALKDRKGRWELADTGTIFLDEIGEIPLELQPKLLRAIQHKEFERVGDEKTKQVDVRIIAATNRDLDQMVKEGSFREDLFYRLNVFPIEVPPLKERSDDIPILTRHFLDESCKRFNKQCYGLNEQTVNELKEYAWPGNIRELQNIIERAVILCEGTSLHVNPDLLIEHSKAGESEHSFSPARHALLKADEIKHLERENIRTALNKANWKISGKGSASEMLGMNASTLNSKIAKLGIKKN
ncbi:MAG: sigma-54 interaction domain-containing protein [Gammaproteobacteria bacterium]